MIKKYVLFFFLLSFALPLSFEAVFAIEKDDSKTQNRTTGVDKQRAKDLNPEQGLGLSKQELAFLRNNPVIRVGNEEGWAPFDFNRHGNPKGYAIDHLEILGNKLGISFEYVNGYSWSELLELFKKDKIDLLPSLWISESRKKYMLFTEPFLKLPYLLVTKSANNSIQGFSDLKGRTVAVAKGYKQEEVLKKHYPQVEMHLVENALEGLKAVSYGKADAYIGYRGTVDHLITTNFFTDLQIRGEINAPELGSQGLYIAVQDSMPLLRSALQKAMDEVSNKQKVKLSKKWISKEAALATSLNKKEKAYLRKIDSLRVNNLMDWPPFDFHENGNPKGFCVDYMQLLADKLGIKIKFVSGPTWKEFLGMIRRREIDLLCDVVETENRKEYIDFTTPYFEIFPGIVLQKKDRDLSELKDLSGKKVAVPKGFYLEEILKKHYPEINVVTRDNTLNCIKSVSSDEVTAALAEKPVFDYLINKHFLMDLKSIPIMDNVYFEDTPVSLGVSKGRETLLNILQKAMDVVSEEELKALKRKWLNMELTKENSLQVAFNSKERNYLAQKDKVRMCVHPDWMPFEGIANKKGHTGIIADIIDLVSERIGVPIEVLPAESWQQSLNRARSKECDIVSSLQKRPERQKDFLFSKPYMESERCIVAKSKVPYIQSMSSLSGKKVGIVKGDPIEQYIRENYPGIKTKGLSSLKEVLKQISREEVDLGIAGLQRVSYKLQELGLYDLKIAGQTPFKRFLRFGINKKEKELQSILNKAIDSISSQEISRINQKWLAIKYEQGFNYDLFWKILAIMAVVVAGFIYWNRKLARLNREIAEAHRELNLKSKELERLSVTDALTGAYNRLRLEQILEREFERGKRYQRPLSIIMVDIDDFKEVNDTYGHQAGDEILRLLAQELTETIRETDTLGRWGGEEFLIVCPETSLQGANILADKLRDNVDGYNFPYVGHMSCSFGVAELYKGETIDQLINRVDKFLYRAKEEGKNCVFCSETEKSD